MKKLFVSILALAAFAACQSDFNDVNLDAPQGGSVVNQGAHTIYAEVGVGEEDTKATYGDGLKATWEQGDQLALLQENANYDSTFDVVNKLNIKEGWGTSKALFNGDISVDATSPRIYHIAYPASAVSFSTNLSLTKSSDSSYETKESTPGMAYFRATANYEYKYISNLNVNVPTEQNGKWEPYMYASTSEAVNAEYIGSKELTTLTGAIAIRAFEADGVTPKQLSSITVTSSDAAIAGVFAGEAISTSTLSVTGDYTSKTYSTEIDSDLGLILGRNSAKKDADGRLEDKAKTTEPTSTSVTKAMSLSFAGNATSVTATNLETIPSDDKGYYTYYVNVAPATLAAGTLTIIAVDTDGSSLTRVVNKSVEVKASHRVGFNLTWETATLKGATIESWYNDWNKGSQFQLAGNTLYVDNISVEGNIAADHVKAIGVRINGKFHEALKKSDGMAISPLVIEGLSSGVYTVQPVAQVELNGELKWLEGGKVEKIVTSIPYVIDYTVRTSYSSNGSVAKTNDINGDILRVKANISDSYVANNLVNGKSYTICYGNNTATQTLGAEKDITLAHTAWGQYVCYVKISLANGYVVESTKYTTHVTGIPYSYDFYQGGKSNIVDLIDAAGWKRNGTTGTYHGNQFFFGKKTNDTGYVVSPKFYVPANISTTTTIKHRAYDTATGGGSCNAYVGASPNQTTKVQTATYSIGVSNDTGTGGMNTHKGDDKDVVLTSANPYICISSGGIKTNAGVYKRHYLHAATIEYR